MQCDSRGKLQMKFGGICFAQFTDEFGALRIYCKTWGNAASGETAPGLQHPNSL